MCAANISTCFQQLLFYMEKFENHGGANSKDEIVCCYEYVFEACRENNEIVPN